MVGAGDPGTRGTGVFAPRQRPFGSSPKKCNAGWAEHQLKTIHIDPGSPWQNGFVESFHARFRDEGLNQEQLWTLTEARVVVADFRAHDNHARPHGKPGYQSPVRFAAQSPRLATLTEAGQNNPPTLHTHTDHPLG